MGAARVLSGQLPTRGVCHAGAISLLGSLALPWALPLASRQLSPGPSRQGAQAMPHTRLPISCALAGTPERLPAQRCVEHLAPLMSQSPQKSCNTG